MYEQRADCTYDGTVSIVHILYIHIYTYIFFIDHDLLSLLHICILRKYEASLFDIIFASFFFTVFAIKM